jgi:carbamoyl-phosphate synthase large subunit
VLGVDMASTGEVGCLGDNFDDALLKSIVSVGYPVPEKGILISSGDALQKASLLDACRMLAAKGYKIYATGGTQRYLSENGVYSMRAVWPSEYEQDKSLAGKFDTALDLLEARKVDLVINIPKNYTHVELTNGYRIRRAAVDFNIPLITNARLATAFVRAFCAMGIDSVSIKSADEFYQSR